MTLADKIASFGEHMLSLYNIQFRKLKCRVSLLFRRRHSGLVHRDELHRSGGAGLLGGQDRLRPLIPEEKTAEKKSRSKNKPAPPHRSYVTS